MDTISNGTGKNDVTCQTTNRTIGAESNRKNDQFVFDSEYYNTGLQCDISNTKTCRSKDIRNSYKSYLSGKYRNSIISNIFDNRVPNKFVFNDAVLEDRGAKVDTPSKGFPNKKETRGVHGSAYKENRHFNSGDFSLPLIYSALSTKSK
mmetsp:Transcript_7811/g.8052  ORF Transcript_7811/g.8052 Transcript_7811/m.8052 type:complete len:149 (+) Transcript_7811:2-448(+)